MIVLKFLLIAIFFIGSVYELMIAISFLLSWFPRLYGTKIYQFFMRVTGPFRKICCGKIILGMFDVGATLGLIGFGYMLSFILNLAYWIQ